jgi:hypothetical protein
MANQYAFDPNFLERFGELWKSHELTKDVELVVYEDKSYFELKFDLIKIYHFGKKPEQYKLERYKYDKIMQIIDDNDKINEYNRLENYIFREIISTHIRYDTNPIGKIKQFHLKNFDRLVVPYPHGYHKYIINFVYYATIVKDTRWSILKIVLVSFYKQDGNFSIIPMELIQYIFSFLGIVYTNK